MFNYYRWIFLDWLYFKIQAIGDFQYEKLHIWLGTINWIANNLSDYMSNFPHLYPKKMDGDYYTWKEILHIRNYVERNYSERVYES